jgi:hypothetical protein
MNIPCHTQADITVAEACAYVVRNRPGCRISYAAYALSLSCDEEATVEVDWSTDTDAGLFMVWRGLDGRIRGEVQS